MDKGTAPTVIQIQVHTPPLVIVHHNNVRISVVIIIAYGDRIVKTFIFVWEESRIGNFLKTIIILFSQVPIQGHNLNITAYIPISSLPHNQQIEIPVIVKIKKHCIGIRTYRQIGFLFKCKNSITITPYKNSQFIPDVGNPPDTGQRHKQTGNQSLFHKSLLLFFCRQPAGAVKFILK